MNFGIWQHKTLDAMHPLYGFINLPIFADMPRIELRFLGRAFMAGSRFSQAEASH